MPVPLTRLSALLLALPLAIGAPAFARDAAGTAAAFDREFARLDSPDASIFQLHRPGQRNAGVDRLRTLVPPGDPLRELRYRMLACLEPGVNAHASVALASAGLADARRLGDRTAEIRFLYCRAGSTETASNPRVALADYSAGIRLAREVRDWRLAGDGLVQRGNVRSLLGEQALALIDMLAAQRAYEAAGLPWRTEGQLQSIAAIYRRVGDHRKALEYLDRSRALAEREDDASALVLDALQRGFIYTDLGRHRDALAENERALRIAQERDTGGTDPGAARMGMATSYIRLGEPRRALELIEQARADFAAAHDPSYESLLQLRTGEARAALGEHAIALGHFERAARAFAAEGNDRYLALLYPARARSHEALGQAGAALADYKRHVALEDRLRKTLGDQRSQLMRHQFDASRGELENRRLVAQQSLHEEQVDTLLAARRWQWGALAIGLVLVLVMVALVLRQMRRSRRLGTLVLTDELTGVANRRRLDVFGEDAIMRARSYGRPLSVLALDVDHFKSVNDTHGHAVGDAVLVRVARVCQGTLRDFDLIGRTGGEEFMVVLPGTGLEAACQVAERLRAAVERLDFGDLAPGLRMTVSIGATTLQTGDVALTGLLRRADAALYRAKRTGRNRVETAHGEPDLDATPTRPASPAGTGEPAAIAQM